MSRSQSHAAGQHDARVFYDSLPESMMSAALPNWHYQHIRNDVRPALRQRGVTDEQINTMLVQNPPKIFENQSGY